MTLPAHTGIDWLFASKQAIYRSDAALRNLSEINWSEAANAHVREGDGVLLYTSKPTQAITHECIVVATGLPFIDRIDDAEYWSNPGELEARRQRSWMRLRLLRTFDENERQRLSLEELLAHGLKRAPQGRRRVPVPLAELVRTMGPSR